MYNLSSDPIPNIRFNVAKSLEQIIPVMKKGQQVQVINEGIKPTLMKLNEDQDQDVRYFAHRALLAC
jgi:serine/threonine-protein phosphatase 2A regulatory subunit A